VTQDPNDGDAGRTDMTQNPPAEGHGDVTPTASTRPSTIDSEGGADASADQHG
jgi:hypothetical protein